ncbi:HU family DNA-binding protein, partial [Acinetobacter baumannii]|nr:HU family DNA-binding protein [Acinetobacter baumannii]
MNKSDLIANIAIDAELTKTQAAAALQAVEDAITAALAE